MKMVDGGRRMSQALVKSCSCYEGLGKSFLRVDVFETQNDLPKSWTKAHWLYSEAQMPPTLIVSLS